MTDSRTLPIVGAAFAAPVLLPTLATIAPPLLIGAALGLALVAILRNEKPKADGATPDGNPPPAPNPPQKKQGVLDTFFSGGWFFDDEPAAPVPVAMTQAEVQERLRRNEAALVTARREVRESRAEKTALEDELAGVRARRLAEISALAVRPAQAPVPLQSTPRPTAPVRPQVTTPAPTIPAAPISAPKPAVTPRLPATPAASQAPAVTRQAESAPAVAVAAPVPVTVEPSKFQLFAPKVNREDLAVVFDDGRKRLPRKDAVAALKARGVKQTTAYNALRGGGRFADLLEVGEDGLLAFKADARADRGAS